MGGAVGGREKLHEVPGGMVCAHCAIYGGVRCRSINTCETRALINEVTNRPRTR
jgi:hypothetical protein